MATTNSGGASGTAFDAVSIGASGTATFDSTIKAHGNLAYKFTNPATSVATYAQWSNLAIAAGSDLYFRGYFYPSQVTLGLIVMRYYDQAAAQESEILLQGGVIAIRNASGTAIQTGTKAIAANAWFRIELRVRPSSTAGQIEYRLFVGANVDGTTADEAPAAATGVTTIGNTIGNNRMGNASSASAASQNVWMDDVAVSATGWPGPAVTAAAAAPTRPVVIPQAVQRAAVR